MFTSPADPAVRLTPVAPSRPRTTRTDRLILLGLCGLAAVLFAWGISRSQFHPFYADAVRSMTLSWKGFLFGSFDPGNTITLDKLPGFLWPQAIAARLLGFHPWVLTLPQVVEGVASVGVLHVLVRRWAGRTAGVLAALGFMLTPVVTGLFRTAVEDPAFTLLLLLAAEATTRAARTGRTRTLLLAAAWVGLAFQAKMLEAFAVLPPLAAVYLISSPAPLRRRCAQLGVAGALTVLVSASWMALVAVTPPADRPYVDGTTDNSPVSMVVGYNFLNRFSSVGLSATGTGSVSAVRGGGGPGGSAAPHTPDTEARTTTTSRPPRLSPDTAGPADRNDGWAKLLRGSLATQVGWLYPTALAGLAAGLIARRGRPRTDPVRAGYLLWGGWLAVFFVVLSAGSVAGHAYYLGVVAAPLAALSGAGIPELWRAYRAATGPSTASVAAIAEITDIADIAPDASHPSRPSRPSRPSVTRLTRLAALALPVTAAAAAAWAVVLSRPYPGFRPWVTPTVALLGGLCVALLLLPLVLRPLKVRPRPRLARTATATAVASGLAAALLAPSVWTSSVFDARYAHSMMGALGPSGQFAFGAGTGAGGSTGRASNAARNAMAASWGRLFGGGGGNGGHGSSSLDAGERALLAYTTAHRGAARYLFATTSWTSAAPFILATGAPVMPMGGFTEQVPWPTVGVVRQDVAAGRLRYVLVGQARTAGLTPGAAGSTAGTSMSTSTNAGTAVAGPAAGRGGQRARTGDRATATSAVSSWVTAACRPVVVPGWQTSRQDSQRLYDCAPASTAGASVTTGAATAATGRRR